MAITKDHINHLAKTRLENTGLTNDQIYERANVITKVVYIISLHTKLDRRRNVDRALKRNIDIQIILRNKLGW